MPGLERPLAICPLASGSKGNAYWIESGSTRALVDVGISLRQLTYRIADIGRDIADVEHIFLTHEHRDHVHALGTLLKKHRPTIWATGGTLRALRGSLPDGASVRRINGRVEQAGDLQVTAIPVRHDAAEPVAYRFDTEESSAAVLTDLGEWDEAIAAALGGPELLVCEANHDPEMLARGRYPLVLKRRIASSLGHLSNEEAAALSASAVRSGTRHILLAHLSEENNSPSLALDTVASRMEQEGCPISVEIAQQQHPGPWRVAGTAKPTARLGKTSW